MTFCILIHIFYEENEAYLSLQFPFGMKVEICALQEKKFWSSMFDLFINGELLKDLNLVISFLNLMFNSC